MIRTPIAQRSPQFSVGIRKRSSCTSLIRERESLAAANGCLRSLRSKTLALPDRDISIGLRISKAASLIALPLFPLLHCPSINIAQGAAPMCASTRTRHNIPSCSSGRRLPIQLTGKSTPKIGFGCRRSLLAWRVDGRRRWLKSSNLWERKPHGPNSRIFSSDHPNLKRSRSVGRADGIAQLLPSPLAGEILPRLFCSGQLARRSAPSSSPVLGRHAAKAARAIEDQIFFFGHQ
jgi:hypothetical protein